MEMKIVGANFEKEKEQSKPNTTQKMCAENLCTIGVSVNQDEVISRTFMAILQYISFLACAGPEKWRARIDEPNMFFQPDLDISHQE